MKTAMMIDMIRAMLLPLYSSRTMATAITRGAEAAHTSAKKVSIETENFQVLEVPELKNLTAEKVLDVLKSKIPT